jgi:hypothetical protein
LLHLGTENTATKATGVSAHPETAQQVAEEQLARRTKSLKEQHGESLQRLQGEPVNAGERREEHQDGAATGEADEPSRI